MTKKSRKTEAAARERERIYSFCKVGKKREKKSE
jgi:hypothetical protein